MMLAGVAALVAALVVYSALKKREQEVQQAMAQSVNIVVATHDLHIGAQLDPTAVKLARWSRDSMPPGAFTDADGFYAPTITQAGFDGTIALDGPIMPATPQPTVIFIEG
jgi:Flp pilus assembly protein CpaB